MGARPRYAPLAMLRYGRRRGPPAGLSYMTTVTARVRDGGRDLRGGDPAGPDDAPAKLLRVHQRPFSGPAAPSAT
jgi:hypothetical protein